MHSVPVQGLICQELWMGIFVVASDGPGSYGIVTICTMVCQLTCECLVEYQARYAFVSEMHTKIWAFTNRHDRVLGRVKQQTDSFVDVIP